MTDFPSELVILGVNLMYIGIPLSRNFLNVGYPIHNLFSSELFVGQCHAPHFIRCLLCQNYLKVRAWENLMH